MHKAMIWDVEIFYDIMFMAKYVGRLDKAQVCQ